MLFIVNFYSYDLLKFIDEQGNTFLYLLWSRASVLDITDLHRRDIDELKKVKTSLNFIVVTTISYHTQFYCFLVFEY